MRTIAKKLIGGGIAVAVIAASLTALTPSSVEAAEADVVPLVESSTETEVETETETVTVTFDPQGGALPEDVEATRTVDKGAALGELPELTREGFWFMGWFTEPSGAGEEVTDTTTVDTNTTIYAYWIEYVTLTFDVQGGELPSHYSDATTSVAKGKAVDDLPKPTREGFGFYGWFTEQNGAGEEVTDATIVDADLTIYAYWIEQVTLTFDPQGGAMSTGNEELWPFEIDKGTPFVPLKPVLREDFTFGGWFTGKNGTGERLTGLTVVSTDMTVYAKWTEGKPANSQVTFDFQGGEMLPDNGVYYEGTDLSVSVHDLAAIGVLPVPAREGFTFEGWNTKADGTGEKVTVDMRPTTDVTVYAQWKKVVSQEQTESGSQKPGKPESQVKLAETGAATGGIALAAIVLTAAGGALAARRRQK